ncbi:unnamed protein product [Camellia sinensis]
MSGGWIADTLVSKGLSVTTVRKIMQSIGFLGPAFFLTHLSHVKTPALAVLCMACSQVDQMHSQSGLYSNHQDIGPRCAGITATGEKIGLNHFNPIRPLGCGDTGR